ncbi:MAG: single-stranded-DNA-specific exonuclease [Chloroflexi bacterium OLB14]|nr:MAG: single-stranded-DNA-specific exonuclease [Chloroflexi bacterium OLB14]
MTRWLDLQPVEIPASFSRLELSPLIAQTLLRRGINSPEDVEAFLYPEKNISTQFPNIESAVEVINQHIKQNNMICVWGDFDVDGQTSTALLVQTLQALNANVIYYVPIRGKENHGVHIESLTRMIDNGAKLILTCDTGITAHEAVDFANAHGVDVVITDHHDLGETLPNAKAIINPKLLPQDHPLKHLAGVGVAYKLAEALITNYELQITNHESRITPENLLDLVALGLIADVALLKDETRTLAKKGIEQLKKTNRIGLKAIAELSNTNLETLTEETIGFTFAPRLNALGRLGDANPAVELLTTNNQAHARVLATQIEGLNAQRRLLTSQVYQSAEAQLKENPKLLDEPAIVLSHPNWAGGVVGIVANKLVERYHKPAILLNESDDGILRGSARSIEGLHITDAIATQKDILLGFGGHPMAAGMSLKKDDLILFRTGLGKAIKNQLGDIVFDEPTLQIDFWLGLDQININLADSLEILAPFGAGNPELTLATKNVILKSKTEIGKTKEHLRINIEDENGNTQSILYWGGAGADLPENGSKIDIAYSLRSSSYRGQRQINLQFQDFRIVEEAVIEIRESGFDIRDMRLESGKFESLKGETLVWAEGNDKSKGKSRFDLIQADEFAIYTTPPSPAELRKALEIVKPKIIYVLGTLPSEEKPDEFLNRLAGLCKFALNKKDGKTSIQELASAMASKEIAVEIGLQWLVAGGHLLIDIEESLVKIYSAEDGGTSTNKQEKNPYLQAELFIALRGVFE